MKKKLNGNNLKTHLVFIVIFVNLFASFAQATMIPTATLINADSKQHTQLQLQSALSSDELKQQLVSMGVDPEQLNDRISSLTPHEIQQLSVELENQPAGGALGVLAAIFIVFIFTDMLCATDLFTFVKCIN